jgi:FkbM family methyltransferase
VRLRGTFVRTLFAAARVLERSGLRSSPLGRALSRAARSTLLRPRAGLPGRPVTVDAGGVPLLMPHVAAAALLRRPAASLVAACLDDAARPGGRVIDVGANVGLHAIRLARLVGPEGRVYAVEPAPDNLAYLRANLERLGVENVEVLALAASDERGTRRFFLQERPTHHGFYERPEGRGRAIEVATAPLDDRVDGPVDLVKIDTEGAEIEVLRGLEGLLAASPDIQVIAEWNLPLALQEGRPEALPEWLRAHGFEAVVLDDETGERATVEEVLERLRRGELRPLRALDLHARRRPEGA